MDNVSIVNDIFNYNKVNFEGESLYYNMLFKEYLQIDFNNYRNISWGYSKIKTHYNNSCEFKTYKQNYKYILVDLSKCKIYGYTCYDTWCNMVTSTEAIKYAELEIEDYTKEGREDLVYEQYEFIEHEKVMLEKYQLNLLSSINDKKFREDNCEIIQVLYELNKESIIEELTFNDLDLFFKYQIN